MCCTFFSLIAIVFLVRTVDGTAPRHHVSSHTAVCHVWLHRQTWVGVYISKDTEYVELTIPADEAATQVFVAAGLYGVTLAISVGFWVKAIWQARNMGPGHHRLDNQF